MPIQETTRELHPQLELHHALKRIIRIYMANDIRDQRRLETPALTIIERNNLIRAYARRTVKNLLPF